MIVPVYNPGAFFDDCISSLLKQTYTDMEIILVDDGSTDGSSAKCDEYCKDHKNIRCIHGENQGACYARKKGAKIASGSYLGFIDSDDMVDADYFEHLLSFSENGDADIVTSGFEIGKTKIIDRYPTGSYEGESLKEIYKTMIFDPSRRSSAMLCSLCTKIIKKELFLEVIETIPDGLRTWEDLPYLYQIIRKAKKICITDYVGYHYRQNPDSTSHVFNEKRYKNTVYSLKLSKSIYGRYEIEKPQIEQLTSFIMFNEIRDTALSCNDEKMFADSISVMKEDGSISEFIVPCLDYAFFDKQELRMVHSLVQGDDRGFYRSCKNAMRKEKLHSFLSGMIPKSIKSFIKRMMGRSSDE